MRRTHNATHKRAMQIGDGLWVDQDLDLGFVGKLKIKTLFSKADGSIKQIKMDGKDQEIRDTSNVEVVEMKESAAKVPAGSFKCIYVKIRDMKSGNVTEGWVNPKEVPIFGTIKTLGQSQLGQVTQELTSYKSGA